MIARGICLIVAVLLFLLASFDVHPIEKMKTEWFAMAIFVFSFLPWPWGKQGP